MLDDLRNSASSSLYEEQEDSPSMSKASSSYGQDRRILGMTAPQRFVVILMLLMMTCVLGAFCLLVTERMVIPF